MKYSLFLLLFLLSCSGRENITHGTLLLKDPWLRPAAAGMSSAAYFRIENGTGRNDTIVGVECRETASAELHRTLEENGLMRMKRVGQLVIPAGEAEDLRPGGTHCMLIGLKRPFAPGDSLRITLRFAVAGTRELVCAVRRDR